jgi:hypothetical protein
MRFANLFAYLCLLGVTSTVSTRDTTAQNTTTATANPSYYPHWVTRDGTITEAIMQRLDPGTIIAAHHVWDLAAVSAILDFPIKNFKVSWYAEANVWEIDDPIPTGITVEARIAEGKLKQDILIETYGAHRFANMFELDGAREKKMGHLRGAGNQSSDWLADANAIKNNGFRYVAKSPTVDHLEELRTKFGTDFVAHVVFEDVTGNQTDENPGYGEDADALAAFGEKLTLIIHEGAYGNFPATALDKAQAVVGARFNGPTIEAYWGRASATHEVVRVKRFNEPVSTPSRTFPSHPVALK